MLLVALLSATALAGCVGDQEQPETLKATVWNNGDSGVGTTLAITDPNGTVVLRERFEATAGNTTFSVPMDQPGTYVVETSYHETSASGTQERSVSGGWTHRISQADCQTATVEIVFTIYYSESSSGHTFNNEGSFGQCLEA